MMDRLPDTPWHVGYALKKENDPRRHQSRCIYYDKKTKYCTTAQSPYVGIKCCGSAHCNAYAEARTEEVKQKEREFKKSVQHVVLPRTNTVQMGDKVVIRNNRTRQEKAYIMMDVLGKPTEFTRICLQQKVGFTFKSEKQTYQIMKIEADKTRVKQNGSVTVQKSAASTKIKNKSSMSVIDIHEINYPVIGNNQLPDRAKGHKRCSYAILVNDHGKTKKVPAIFDEVDKVFYVIEGAYKKYFR